MRKAKALTNKIGQAAIVLGLMFCSNIGCDEDDYGDYQLEKIDAKGIIPVASRLQDRGIKILSKQPQKALRGSFTQNAETIYFEAVRGKESQTWEFNGGPRYEVDVRFVDSTGRTFAAQAGGHSLVNPKSLSQ